MAFATQGLMTIASRMVMTLARDQGVGHLSPWLGQVSPRFEVPTWSVVFTTVWVIIFGLICESVVAPVAKFSDLGSSVATNAILSASVVLLQISYFTTSECIAGATPNPAVLLVVLRGKTVFKDQPMQYSLGRWRSEHPQETRI